MFKSILNNIESCNNELLQKFIDFKLKLNQICLNNNISDEEKIRRIIILCKEYDLN